ncbi:Ig-like domain-containing protein [Acinetobacter sp. YH12023]|uniref:Ig-like domain-containing protein n=1 Tax=Acinetobacter sp. YH12023 TaxID=2601041 RepID=UPI0015D271D2|nr:Ig-like domain-containing protein [Acinetobacter sp. YH12023]
MQKKQVTMKLSAVALAVLLASCGGGGSDGYFNQGESNNGNGSGTDNGIETPVVAKLNITNVELADSNNLKTTILTILGASASVKVTDQNGQPVSGALVTFTGENITFETSNATVLSNAEGVAKIGIKPTDETKTGIFKISANAELNGNTANTSDSFVSVEALKTKFDNLTFDQSSIDAGGTVKISLTTVDATSNAVQNNVQVNFKADCGTFTNSSVNSNQGLVETTYTAISSGGQLCSSTQAITITANNGATTTTKNITINPIKANSLVYSSGEVKLGAANSGSSASGKVEFTVYSNNLPAKNQDVLVELIYAPTDLSFIALHNKTQKVIKSNDDGKIVVDIFPGSLPGPVELKATLVSDTSVSALTKDVSVATGRVTQNGLSLSVSKNALQWDVDGDKATIVARLRDRVGNKVPDGTVVSFVTEGGSITPNCSTADGECSVVLQTQNPRPADNRVTVLAYVEGDKSYIDKDSDNLYTAGVDELTSNIGDFFRDDNENTIFEAALGEFLYKRGAVGNTCAASTFIQPNISGTCNTELSAVIRQQLVFSFSNDVPTITNLAVSETKSNFTFKLFGNSAQSVPMPTGTTVALKAEDNTKDNEKSCSAELWSGNAAVPSVFNLLTPSTFSSSSQVFYSYRLKECDSGDSLVLSVTAPTGQITKQEYTIR